MHNAIEALPADIDLAVSQPWAYLVYVAGTTPAEGGGGGARQHLLAWLMDAAILEAIELIFGLACIFLFCLLSGLLCGVHNNHGAGEGPQGLWDMENVSRVKCHISKTHPQNLSVEKETRKKPERNVNNHLITSR